MNTFPLIYNRLQLALLALLPADGMPVTVSALAEAEGVSDYRVTCALFDPYLAHQVDYDVCLDAYSAPQPRGLLNKAYSPQMAGASSY